MPTTSAVRFSAQLRDATATAHRDAERAPYVHRLFRGQLPLGGVTDLTAQLWFVYGALEVAGSALRQDPVVARLARPELDRVPAIEADLAVLMGNGWRDQVRALPATDRYVERIAACVDEPHRYVAHHYTRLLGDLSGGQMIRATLQRHYGGTIDGALSFYDMSHLGDLDAYKDDYRTQLDRAPWSEAQRASVIDEARRAFGCNSAVFTELGDAWPG
jgi:heme oxygenase